jgi:hypothetical protein
VRGGLVPCARGRPTVRAARALARALLGGALAEGSEHSSFSEGPVRVYGEAERGGSRERSEGSGMLFGNVGGLVA